MNECLPSRERRTIAALSATDEPPTESLSIEGAGSQAEGGEIGRGSRIEGRRGRARGARSAGSNRAGARACGGGPRGRARDEGCGGRPRSTPGGGARGPRGGRTRGAQHRDLLDPHDVLARGGPRAGNPGGQLLRHLRPRIGVHARQPRPQPRRQPVRPGGAVGRVRAGLHRPAPAGPPPRGLPAGLHAVLDHADRARRDHGLLRAHRRGDHAAVHRPHLRRGARHPHRGALAGAVPRRAAARADRPAGGDLAVLRTLHDPRARARGVEHRDHRRARRCCATTSTAKTRSTPTRSAS